MIPEIIALLMWRNRYSEEMEYIAVIYVDGVSIHADLSRTDFKLLLPCYCYAGKTTGSTYIARHYSLKNKNP